MKRFNFKVQLKGMNLDSLKELKSYHLDYMLGFIGLNDKEADKHSRYVGYIDEAISKIKSN
jgi:hypothetical protein